MEFLWPFMLSLLALIPVLVLAYLLAQRRRQKQALRHSNLLFVKQAMARGPGVRRHIPPILYLFCCGAVIVGSARPAMTMEVPSFEGTIILAMDTSGSMAADDVRPNRMEAAKAAALTFIERQPPTVKIGVVSFSDNAFVVQAPTRNQPAVVAAINRLAPQRGTAIGWGLSTSLYAIFETQGLRGLDPASAYSGEFVKAPPTPTPMPRGGVASGIVILLTDGENNQGPAPNEVAEQLAGRDVRVYTIGLGSPQGSVVRIEGQAIHVGLDELALDEVAHLTGGSYYNAVDEVDLKTIFGNLREQLVFRTERTELTAALTGLAAFFALMGALLSLSWFNRLP